MIPTSSTHTGGKRGKTARRVSVSHTSSRNPVDVGFTLGWMSVVGLFAHMGLFSESMNKQKQTNGCFKTRNQLPKTTVKSPTRYDQDDDCIVIYPRGGKNGYAIDGYRIQTKSQLLWWVRHLLDKVWMDTDSLSELIDVSAKVQGMNVWNSAQ
jgi:hypothetical protein